MSANEMIDETSSDPSRNELCDDERKLVTILFADIVKSSLLVSEKDPEDASEILLPILQVMFDSIRRFNGTVAQILGDGILALFGAPVAQEHHAIRACLAADAMQSAIKQTFGVSSPQSGPPIAIRVGLNSGVVVTQTVESDLYRNYRAVGEAVHLAARMESIAKPGSTVLAETTWKLVSDQLKAKPLAPVSLTAGSRAIAAYELTQVTPNNKIVHRLLRRSNSSFIGRQNDVKLMHDVLEDSEKGNRKTLVVTGEAGVGKSRLILEFVDSTRMNKHKIVKCDLLPTGLSTPLEPLAHIVRSLIAIDHGHPDDHVHATASALLTSLHIRGKDATAAILEILNVPCDFPSWLALNPPERLRITVDTVARMIIATSRRQPVIIIFEDFHWADSATRLLVDELIPRLSPSQVWLIITSRTYDKKGPWITWPGVTQHEVRPLSPQQSLGLLHVLLGTDRSLNELKELLIQKSQGIPFFIEECVRSLEETGVLSGVPGSYRLAAPVPSLQIPATVHGVLAARIDALRPADRYVLLCASVVGQSFDVGLLRDLTRIPGHTLLEQLNRLQSAGYIQRTRIMPNVEFSFRHALIHDVAYQTLLRRRRRELHARILVAIKKRRADQISGKIELLAHHAFCAKKWPGTFIYCRKAGQKLLAKSANREAADFFENTLRALKQFPQTRKNIERSIDIRLEFAQSLIPLGEYDQVRRQLLKAEDLADTLQDERRLAKISSILALYHWVTGSIPQAVRTGKTALKLARKLEDFEMEVPSAVRLGTFLVDHGNYESACGLFEDTIARIPDNAIHRRFGLLSVASMACRASLSRSLAELGCFKDAIKVGDEAITIADEAGHVFSQIYACLSVGHVLFRKGDFEQSLPLLQRSFALCEATRLKQLFPLSAGSLGYAYVRTGHVTRGLSLLEDALSTADRQALVLRLSLQLGWLAEAYLSAGRADTAIGRALDALELAQKNGENGNEAWALWLLGEIYSGPRDSSDHKAQRCFRKAQAIAVPCRMTPLLAHCHLGVAKLYRRDGAWDKAQREFASAISLYEELHMVYWLKLAEAEMNRVKKVQRLEVH